MKKIFLAGFICAALLFTTGNAVKAESVVTDSQSQNQIAIIDEQAAPAEQSAVEVKPKKKWFWQRNKEDKNEVAVSASSASPDLQGGVEHQEPAKDAPLEATVEKPAEQKTPLQGWVEGDYMTGDWGGARTWLEEHGVTLEASYTNDTFSKLYGGYEKSKYPIRNFGLIDTAIHLNTEKMGLWKNGEFVVRYQYLRGNSIVENVGAYQCINAYDAERNLNQISEYWYEQGFFDNKIQLKVGKQDAAYDFMALDLATNFVNNSHAYFMPNVPLPSYPDPALGLVLKINPTDWLSLRTGWYDGKAYGGSTGFNTAFDGSPEAFLIQEIGIRHNRNNMPGTILAGGWLHTGHVDDLSDPGQEKGQSMGAYIEAEQMVWKKEKDNPEDKKGLYTLVQYSFAPSDRSEIGNYYGGTLMYKGPFKGRDEDVVGVGAAVAQFSNKLRNIVSDGRRGAETILEAFYKFQLTPWFSIQPVVQCVFRPDGQRANSFVFGLRSVITF